MQLRVNGHFIDIPEEVQTVAALVDFLALQSKVIIVEQNGVILQADEHERAIQPSDSFEIVTFVGGG